METKNKNKKHEAMDDVLRELERDIEDMENRSLWHPTTSYLRHMLERVREALKSEKRETLDIVAEMRTRSREVKEAFGERPDGVENMLDIWANRIEAVAKRGMTEAEANALSVGGIVEAARKREREHVTGCHGFDNAVAIYNALKTIHDKVNSLNEECGVDPVEIRDIARAALSEPPRNCNEYDCKSDAEVGFVEQTGETDANPLYWQLFANWLFAPAAERKGEGDGR